MAASTVRAGRAPLVDATRPVRLKKGAQPTHSGLTGLQQWSWKMFRERVTAKPSEINLEENLLKAHMRIRADEYMAFVYGATLIGAVGLVAAGAVLGLLLYLTGSPVLALLAGLAIPLLGTFGAFNVLKALPGSAAK